MASSRPLPCIPQLPLPCLPQPCLPHHFLPLPCSIFFTANSLAFIHLIFFPSSIAIAALISYYNYPSTLLFPCQSFTCLPLPDLTFPALPTLPLLLLPTVPAWTSFPLHLAQPSSVPSSGCVSTSLQLYFSFLLAASLLTLIVPPSSYLSPSSSTIFPLAVIRLLNFSPFHQVVYLLCSYVSPASL